MTQPDPPVQTALAARYDIEAEIGRGGMATVFRARDRRHGVLVAIKVLRRELVTALGAERFTREVRVTAALQHPHILPLLDSGSSDGLPYYVMPLVTGDTLEQRLRKDGPLPIHEAVQYVAEVADGLAYAHAQGLIHRDIKPANILLADSHALLADFGIARALDSASAEALTESGMALGTAAYMSPEQAAGERVDARADIYALGCVLYELLAGSGPFSGSSQRAIMARHAVDQVPSVRTVRPEVSRGLEAVINRALAKTPADRFANAKAFRVALLEAAARPNDADASRSYRRRLWIVVATIAAVTASGFTMSVLRHRAATVELSARRVMVYPLVLPVDWSGSRSAGEDVSTMIGSVMDGAGSLRWIDGWQQLSPERRDNMRSLSAGEANALARKHHCRYVITGRLAARSADSTDVFLALYDLALDSTQTRHGVAAAGEPWRGGLMAIKEMLTALIPVGGADLLTGWSDRVPQAIAPFLAGEAAFRRLRLEDALQQFKAAVDADSAFGYAALRGAQVASWAHRLRDAKSLVVVAIAHARSPRERALAAGIDAFLDGRADSSVVALRAALAFDPEMSVAWMQLSETYMHLLPERNLTDPRADDALRHAAALDSSATQVLFHQVELAARSHDRGRTDVLAKRFLGSVSDTMLRGEVELIAACVGGRWSDSLVLHAVANRPQPLLSASKMVGLSQPKCMHDGYKALLAVDTANTQPADGRRFFSIVGLHQALLARGDTVAAMEEVDRFITRWKYGGSIFLVDAPVVPAFAARARQVAASDSARYGATFKGAPYSSRLWLLGVWAAFDGKLTVAQAVAADLGARGRRDGQHRDSVRSEALYAHIALARGDTTDAIRRFNALLRQPAPQDSVAWDEAFSLGLERVTLGRLLIARREFVDARAVLEVLESAAPAAFPLYAPVAWQLRAEAAAALGDAAEAAVLRKRATRLVF